MFSVVEAAADSSEAFPRCNTGERVEISHPVGVQSAGVDDISLVLDMDGSRSLGKLQALAEQGREAFGGVVLDYEGSYGKRYGICAPHYLRWHSDSRRLYVQLKRLGGAFGLVGTGNLSAAVTVALMRDLGGVGLYSYEPIRVARVDVAVDLQFADRVLGKRFLDALHSASYSGGLTGRLEYPTTVNVRRPRRTRKLGKLVARSYCRGSLHPELCEPYEVIRLERERHFTGRDRPNLEALTPGYLESIWLEVYGGVGNGERLATVPMEELTMTLLERVKAGEMGVAQAERVRFFLELDRLGVARSYYSDSQYRARKAEARELGITTEDALVTALDVELGELLRVAASGLEPGEAVPA